MPKVRRKQSVPAANLNLEEKLVHVNRVSKVVKGGRRFSFNAIVVVGDGNGVVGHGLGKANEVSDAIQKGFDNAKKNLIRIPLTKSGSVYHQVVGKSRCRESIITSSLRRYGCNCWWCCKKFIGCGWS